MTSSETTGETIPSARRSARSGTWVAAGLLWLAAIGLFAFAPRGASEAGVAAEAWDAEAATMAAEGAGADAGGAGGAVGLAGAGDLGGMDGAVLAAGAGGAAVVDHAGGSVDGDNVGGAVVDGRADGALVGDHADGVTNASAAAEAESSALGLDGAGPAAGAGEPSGAPGATGSESGVGAAGSSAQGEPAALESATSGAQPGGSPAPGSADVPAGAALSGAAATIAPSGPGAATPEPIAQPPAEPATSASPALAAERPIVPNLDAALAARLGAIWADGQAQGRRADVFAKVGDSLTVSGFFLAGLGCNTSRLGLREDLRPLVELYRAAAVPAGASQAPCAAANPLTRRPVSASVGWLTAQVLSPLRGELPPECAPPNHTALRCEVALVQPSMAIVTLGTNDVHMNNGVGAYAGALGRVVDELEALGVIPLLSTLPPRTDRPAMAERTNRYNDVVVAVAAERQVPLVNLWRDLQAEGLVRGGMEPDGVHLNGVGYGASFTEGGLRYGQNRRNALVLDALAKVRRVVVEGGAADG